MRAAALPWTHALLAIAVMAVWGTNFVLIRVALDHLPPLTLAAARFFLACAPAIFFIPRPPVPWRNLAAYGVLIGAGQFGLLFIAMHGHISPGLASLVVQTQVFFTVALSMRLTGEKVRLFQIAALLLAGAGLAVIIARTDADATPLGVGLVLCAALSWSGGNLVARATPGVNMLAYVVWGSLFSWPPLLVLALLIDGPAAAWSGIRHADLVTWGVVVWQSVGNSLFGYAAWGWLLSRHPAAVVSPMALLVPVFGMAASAAWLHESLPVWKLLAAGLVMAGLALNLFWPMVRRPAIVIAEP